PWPVSPFFPTAPRRPCRSCSADSRAEIAAIMRAPSQRDQWEGPGGDGCRADSGPPSSWRSARRVRSSSLWQNVMVEELEPLPLALRASRTDLARLIGRVVKHRRPRLWVDQAAVTAWQSRAPDAWRGAPTWLDQHGIPVFVLGPPHPSAPLALP